MNNAGVAVAAASGLCGMACWGLADFFAKWTIDRLDDLRTLFWSQLIGVVPLLLVFTVQRDVPRLHAWDALWLALFGVVSALSYLPVYTAFGKGQVSVLSPIFASYAALVVLYSTLFFKEAVAGQQWAGMMIVFLGVIVISTDPRELANILRGQVPLATQGLPQILAEVVVYSMWLVLLDRFLRDRPWVMFMLVIRTVAATTLFVFARVTQRGLAIPDRRVRPILGLIGVFDVVAFSSVAYGFAHTTHTSVIAMLSSTFSLPTILLARVFLGERLTKVQALAAATIISGVAVITVA